MEISDFPSPISKKFDSFRNIYTIVPSQFLYDDIVSPEDEDAIFELEKLTSGIESTSKQAQRSFQYCQNENSLACFEELSWKCSRFTNGNLFGVWYGALEEKTSLYEIIYHLRKETKELFDNPKNLDKSRIVDRKFIRAKISANKLIDMRGYPNQEILVSDDYSVCNQIGELAHNHKIDAFFTPSARVTGGICTPIFNDAIIDDKFFKYIKIEIKRNLEVYLNEEQSPLTLPFD
jgi:hypothetical protein